MALLRHPGRTLATVFESGHGVTTARFCRLSRAVPKAEGVGEPMAGRLPGALHRELPNQCNPLHQSRLTRAQSAQNTTGRPGKADHTSTLFDWPGAGRAAQAAGCGVRGAGCGVRGAGCGGWRKRPRLRPPSTRDGCLTWTDRHRTICVASQQYIGGSCVVPKDCLSLPPSSGPTGV